ncbi:50S ribosomal protein L6 [gamma proteobacterium HdN1]|nr:50S ribosomal protein L6 [gamma proteobacterium HdN1]
MSRIAKNPIALPAGVKAECSSDQVRISGPLGALEFRFNSDVAVAVDGNALRITATESAENSAMSGTTRAILNNMVTGVSKGFERKLELVGVGYRAQAKGNVVSLSLGLSHPLDYELPVGVSAATPTQTEIVLKSIDKHLLGHVAAQIRSFRPPEPYKGKGVRYAGEVIRQKEAKKK